ncbi:MAG: DUF1772 domain-containing protein [Acidimicrobiia bacterium]|nr:DUF1772 domain-containing protein [Acidimicrobiia bacterium]
MFEIVLLVATFLVSLVGGILLVFAIVVMPGLGALDDRGFLRAFKVIDRVIQENQPVFVFVWAGSILAVLIAVVLAATRFSGSVRTLALAAAVVYLIGVQISTFVNNIPLNNQLQALELDSMDTEDLAAARALLELPWNRWNRLRTMMACLSSVGFLVAVAQL